MAEQIDAQGACPSAAFPGRSLCTEGRRGPCCNRGAVPRLPVFKPRPHHLPAEWLWLNFLTSVSLSFLVFKMETLS